jgi:hypothetical protein
MKKIISLLFTFIIFFSFLSISNVSSDIFRDDKTEIPYCEWSDCWLEKWVSYVKDAGINGIITEWTASEYIQRIIVYLLYFLKLVAVIIIIYAWFNMLTAAWDDEKFKKSKTMVMYAIIWLAIIYLAWPITSFIIDIFVKS